MKTEKKSVVFKKDVDAFLAAEGINRATARRRRRVVRILRRERAERHTEKDVRFQLLDTNTV